MNNPLVLARVGVKDHLDSYFDKAKHEGKVANWHIFNEVDPQQPQGRVLFVDSNNSGLVGSNDLDNDGRFVGVAPEARR